MLVKELRNLLNDIPENISKEDFDNLEVMFSSTGEFFNPCMENSGLIEFSGYCDEDGNDIEDDDFPENIKAFALLSCGFAEASELQKTAELN